MNTLDALDGMVVVKALSRAVGCVLITGVWAPGVGRTQCLPRVQGALAAGWRTERCRREIAEPSYEPGRCLSVIVLLVACAALALSESFVAWSSRELSSNRTVATP